MVRNQETSWRNNILLLVLYIFKYDSAGYHKDFFIVLQTYKTSIKSKCFREIQHLNTSLLTTEIHLLKRELDKERILDSLYVIYGECNEKNIKLYRRNITHICLDKDKKTLNRLLVVL